MDQPSPSPSAPPPYQPYQPTPAERVVGTVKKHAPFVIGRIIQIIMYAIFQVFQFLKQVVIDAIGR